MAHQYKRVEIRDAPVFDPAPEELVFDAVPVDHKASDLVIGLMRVAHTAKLISRGTLTRVHLSFTSDLRLRQWASGNGQPFIDGDGRAIFCDSTVLHGTHEDLPVSSYTTETILQDEGFREWFFELFGLPQNRLTRAISIPLLGTSSPFEEPQPTATSSAAIQRPSDPWGPVRSSDQQIRYLARDSYNAFLDNIKANMTHIRTLDPEGSQLYSNWLARDLQSLLDELIEPPT